MELHASRTAMAQSTAPPEILALVERFAEHRETYHRNGYNEAQLRHDYLNPFFEALGWDIHNRAGHAEAYRDVIFEHSMRVEETARAPDYLFRISQTPKFFVEAKKLTVDMRYDILNDSVELGFPTKLAAFSQCHQQNSHG